MSAQLDTLVAAEKAAKGPSVEARARIGARLKSSIAAPPAATAPAAAPAAAGGKLLLLVGLGAGALLGAGLHAALTTAPKPIAPTPPTPPAVAVERERPADQLAQERRLLELAREAVARNASSDALVTLGAHRALYPDGQLAEEREALQVQVLVRAGRFDEAKAAGEKFFARYPKGLLAPVVKSALESIPVTGSGTTPQ